MKVKKVASINSDGEVSNTVPVIVTTILSEYSHSEGPTTNLQVPIMIGKGSQKRHILLEVPLEISALARQNEAPVSFDWPNCFGEYEGEKYALFLFRDQFFLASTLLLDPSNQIEASLLIKKQFYSEDNRLKRLKQEVEAIEGAIEQKSTPKRSPISDSVKLTVFTRDDGKCVRCGSTKNLHFDHIIPVAKGGGNSEQNIQILCEHCNLQKSDKIAF